MPRCRYATSWDEKRLGIYNIRKIKPNAFQLVVSNILKPHHGFQIQLPGGQVPVYALNHSVVSAVHLSSPRTRHQTTTCSLPLCHFDLRMSAKCLRQTVNDYLIIFDSASIARSASPAWCSPSGPLDARLLFDVRASCYLDAHSRVIWQNHLGKSDRYTYGHIWNGMLFKKKKNSKRGTLECTCQYMSTWVSQILVF